MPASITTEAVWTEIRKRNFAILSWLSAGGAPRSAGVVYHVEDRSLYIGSEAQAFKVRQIARDPRTSLVITVPRGTWLPIAIPDATISCGATAEVLSADEAGESVGRALTAGMANPDEMRARMAVLRVTPVGEFLTYGIGVSLLAMRDPELASGRVAV